MSDLREFLAVMRVPGPLKSCYNCANGCRLTGIAEVPLMADMGQQCKFWRPSQDIFIPTETEIAALKMQWGKQENRRGQKVEKGYCGRPEWADEEGCPMDNPNEEMTDCTGCHWYRETEGQE